MKIKDVENAVQNFCAKENIPLINGCIAQKYREKVEIFLDVLKVSTKQRAKFIRNEPKTTLEILTDFKIKGRRLL